MAYGQTLRPYWLVYALPCTVPTRHYTRTYANCTSLPRPRNLSVHLGGTDCIAGPVHLLYACRRAGHCERTLSSVRLVLPARIVVAHPSVRLTANRTTHWCHSCTVRVSATQRISHSARLGRQWARTIAHALDSVNSNHLWRPHPI